MIKNLWFRLVFHIAPAKGLCLSLSEAVCGCSIYTTTSAHHSLYSFLRTRLKTITTNFWRVLHLVEFCNFIQPRSSSFSFSFLSLSINSNNILLDITIFRSSMSPILCMDAPLSTILKLSIVPPGTSCTLTQRLVGEGDPSFHRLGSSVIIENCNIHFPMIRN